VDSLDQLLGFVARLYTLNTKKTDIVNCARPGRYLRSRPAFQPVVQNYLPVFILFWWGLLELHRRSASTDPSATLRAHITVPVPTSSLRYLARTGHGSGAIHPGPHRLDRGGRHSSPEPFYLKVTILESDQVIPRFYPWQGSGLGNERTQVMGIRGGLSPPGGPK
jgi:hypothetical protein